MFDSTPHSNTQVTLYLDAAPDALRGLLVLPYTAQDAQDIPKYGPKHEPNPASAFGAEHGASHKPPAFGTEYEPTCGSPCLNLPAAAGFLDWQQALRVAGHPMPEQVIACGALACTLYDDANWSVNWRAVMDDADSMHRPIRSCDLAHLPSPLASWSGGLGATALALPQEAAVRGALRVPAIAQRVQRQGGIVMYCGSLRTSVFLVFRGRIWAVWEDLPLHQRSVEAWLADLREFRLLWLPHEVVRQHGGTGCLFASAIPEDAESFDPLWLIGPCVDSLAEHGRILVGDEAAMLCCRGMISPAVSCE